MLDLTPPLIESARTGNIPWFAGDTHPNAVGHRVAADAIKEWDVVKQWNSKTIAGDESKTVGITLQGDGREE